MLIFETTIKASWLAALALDLRTWKKERKQGGCVLMEDDRNAFEDEGSEGGWEGGK